MSVARRGRRGAGLSKEFDASSSLDHLLIRKISSLVPKPILGFGPGDALFVDLSTNPDAGHGLFSKLFFVPGDVITLYDGIAVNNIHATDASKDKGDLSHACKVKGTEYLIIGLRYVLQKRGLG